MSDTIFLRYPTAREAILDALAAHRRLRTVNRQESVPIHASIGIGERLVIAGYDGFGAEVHRAFGLGEDVARGGETLVSPIAIAAMGGLPDGSVPSAPRRRGRLRRGSRSSSSPTTVRKRKRGRRVSRKVCPKHPSPPCRPPRSRHPPS